MSTVQTENKILINVRKKIAEVQEMNFELVGGNDDYKVVFDFDSDWEGHDSKTALFVTSNRTIKMSFSGNECKGVEIRNSSVCYIGVFSGNIITTTPATVTVKYAITDISSKIEDPDIGLYNELIETLNEGLAKKVDLITTPAENYRVYAADQKGEPAEILVDDIDTAKEFSIPVRNQNLNIFLPNEPTEPKEASNKEYVDSIFAKINTNLSSIYKYKGSVNDYAELPTPALNIGDVYNVINKVDIDKFHYPAGTNFAWSGTDWDALGGDLNEYLNRLSEVEADIDDLKNKPTSIYYNHIIDNPIYFDDDNLFSHLSGNVLVKGVRIEDGERRHVDIPRAITKITFIDCYMSEIALTGQGNAIEGFRGEGILTEFSGVENCWGNNLRISSSNNIRNSRISCADECNKLTNVHVWSDTFNTYIVFYRCRELSNISVSSSQDAVNNHDYITFGECEQLSNIVNLSPEVQKITYRDCTYVDGDTCDDYYTSDDVGKVPVITADGTKQTTELPSQPIEEGQGQNSIQQKEAKALGNNCLAFNNSVAGCLGYRYKAIDLANRKIYLTTEEIPVINGVPQIAVTTTGFDDDSAYIENITLPYEVGDTFTLKTRGVDFDNVGTITAINKNVVTFASAGTKLDRLAPADVLIEDTYVDRYSFSVPSKPDKGEVIVSENATAFGGGSKALGRDSFVAGRNLTAIGDMAVMFGRDSTAGYQAFLVGQDCYGKSSNFTWGYKCHNKGRWSAVFGSRNSTYFSDYEDPAYCFVAGTENAARNDGSVIFGLCNGQTARKGQTVLGEGAQYVGHSQALFIIGNGAVQQHTDGTYTAYESERSNAFVVWEDGRATVGADPSKPMDVATRQYVHNSIAKLVDSAPEALNTLNELAIALTEHEDAYDALLETVGKKADTTYVDNYQPLKFSIGTNNTVSSPMSVGVGDNVGVFAQASAAIGRDSRANVQYSMAAGLGVETDTTTSAQVVVGRHNNIVNNAMFIVGIGNEAYEKNNGLVVHRSGQVELGKVSENKGLIVHTDGRATIGADPRDAMDVVPKHMYDALLARIETLEAKLLS